MSVTTTTVGGETFEHEHVVVPFGESKTGVDVSSD